MYTKITNVQILLSLLKEYGLNHVVLSPGGSDIPLIYSMQNDSFFTCYSIVDERSALYFALGLSQQLNMPIVCVCTSGTAVSNYLPGITEAFYQNVPIIAITADKNPYRTNQLETQKIQQVNIFGDVCKKSVDLPIIHSEEERKYCIRLINEALLELNHHGKGPVHINIPVMGSYFEYTNDNLPLIRKVNRIDSINFEKIFSDYVKKLKKFKRIMVLVGQNEIFSKEDIEKMNLFFSKFNCFFAVENISNLSCNGALNLYPALEGCSKETLDKLAPDLIISLGNNISAYQFKPFIRRNSEKVIHWSIDECGRYRDMFDCLDTIFEMDKMVFFDKVLQENNEKNNYIYYNEWLNLLNKIEIKDLKFSSMYVAQQVSQKIQEGSILHLAVLNSTRIMQFFKLNKNVKVYSNLGALGIDGCLSTFLGQANATESNAYCIIGDLSFFYDMNSLGIKHLNNNVKIILLNNSGACEFHLMAHNHNIDNLNEFISVKHNKKAKDWVNSLGIKYYSAKNKQELDSCLDNFIEYNHGPALLEVFTSMEMDSIIEGELYDRIKISTGGTKEVFKQSVKNVLSDKQVNVLKK